MSLRIRHLDPLVIFIVLGGLLAGLHLLTRGPGSTLGDKRVVVTDAHVAWIVKGFEKRRLRPPTRAELDALVDRHIRDEVLYREAVALGFDKDDPALRRRLAMKLSSLAQDLGAALEPTEAELEAWYQTHAAARYSEPPRRRFEHVYLSEDRRGARLGDDVARLLAALRAHPDQDLSQVGDPILIEIEQPLLTADEVKGQIGGSFAEALFGLELRTWAGPIRSGFGLHLVRVLEEEPGRLPRLDQVRDEVRRDFLQERKDAALESYLEALLRKYDVQVEARLLTAEPTDR